MKGRKSLGLPQEGLAAFLYLERYPVGWLSALSRQGICGRVT
jgi:hypothetical protein